MFAVRQFRAGRRVGTKANVNDVTSPYAQAGLEVVAETTRFNDFPAVEWVLRFKNRGITETPILEHILPFDVRIPAGDQNGRPPDVWLAYQLHLPERDEGLVVALKRPASSSTKAALRLHDLAREATYEVTFFDTAESKRISGSELTGTGLEIELSHKPDSALVRYCRVP